MACPMKKRKYRVKQILDVIWPYLLLTALILALFGVGLGIGYEIIEDNAENQVEKRISELSDDIYETVVCYTKICDVLAANDAAISFFDIQPDNATEYQTAVSYLKRELNDVKEIANVPLSSIDFFYPEKQTIISADSYVFGKDLCEAEFENRFAGVITPKILQDISPDNHWAIYYGKGSGWIVCQLSHKSGSSAYVILEYQLNQLVPLSGEEGLVILGDDDSIIYSSNENITLEEYGKIRSAFQDNHRVRRNKETFIASRCVFSLMRTDIMIVMSVNHIISEMAAFQRLLLALGSVCLICLAMIYYAAYQRIVLPYRYFAEAVDGKSSQTNFRAVLSDARTNLLSVKSQQKAADEERAYLIPLGVGELLQVLSRAQEDFSLQIANRCLSLSGIRPGQRYLLFAIFHMEDPEHVFDSMRRTTSKVTPMFVLNNLMKDLLFYNRVGIVATVNRSYFVISTCAEGDTVQTIEETVGRLAQFYREHYAVTVAVTKPVIGSSPEELQHLVKKTMDDVAYMQFWHKDQIAVSENGQMESLTSYFKAMRNLINRLDIRDYPGAQIMFRQILEKELPRGVHELHIAKYRIYSLIEALAAAISEQFDQGEDAIHKLDYEKRLYDIDNINAFRLESEKVFMEIIEIRHRCDTEKDSARKIEKVRVYIDHHYADNDLAVSSIAEHFGMSAPYLSREFKRIIDCNVLDYIQKLRIGSAKKLLREYSVKDAGLKAGFGDTQGFIRVFKKYEGITPGEYKKALRQE